MTVAESPRAASVKVVDARGLPAALKTIGDLDHCSLGSKVGISLEFSRKFANRNHRDSSDHCSTN
jgi:hypothetical protein